MSASRRSRIIALWLARLGLLVAGAVALGATQSPPPPDRRVIRIRAERFSFTPSEIRLTTGETVEFRIKSDDTAHGFRIVGTHTDIVVPKRGRGEIAVVFTAPTAGDYAFECTEMCGAGHDFMRGVIRVQAQPTPRAEGGGR
jgi:cytochrome c oxidase subunit II